MKTYIADLQKIKNKSNAIKKAAGIIKNGGIVVFPTETVYGIGANAFNKDACARIFKIKGRKSDNPLIVHASDIEMVKKIGVLSKKDQQIMERLWPGPVTIILKAMPVISKVITGGIDTVAVRIPSNKIAINLIKYAGVPIAAPSANPSGFPSATSGDHAEEYFNGKVNAILKNGRTKYGIESTVIDLSTMEILRPGSFNIKKLERIIGSKSRSPKKNSATKSPGMKYRHYAPKTAVFMFDGDSKKLQNICDGLNNFAVIGPNTFCNKMQIQCKKIILTRHGADDAKRNLFDALIKLDKLHVAFGIIVVSKDMSDDPALINRIEKATSNIKILDKEYLLNVLGNS